MLLAYVFVLVVIGTIAIGLSKHGKALSYFVITPLTLASLAVLGFVLSHFSEVANNPHILDAPWQFPFGKLTVGLDALSLFFIVPLMILTIACTLYGSRYFKNHQPGAAHWLNYALLVAGMVMVLISMNAILFIISWEVMSLASFLLVLTDSDKESVRRAGWIYFVTAHIGTAFLLLTFFLLAVPAGSFEFTAFARTHYTTMQSNFIFASALIAFGFKAGFIPFHVWLPLAHPAAPSHVSGLMSGIMIKMGIYGILRAAIFAAPYQVWWGATLISLGAISGIVGVLFAIGQHDIKRLLAYHSVENIGIILLGMGIGMLGMAYDNAIIAVLGFGGALLHVLNHSIFKSLLFLGAGAVIRQAGSGNIDSMGGMIKRMPWTGSFFILGSIAICGLPFFNGFISEIMIYAAAIIGAVEGGSSSLPMFSAVVVVSLAVIGGLAVACFTKVIGVAFLGEPRGDESAAAKEIPAIMRTGMGFLAFFIVFIGLFSFAVVPFLIPPVRTLVGNAKFARFAPLVELSHTLSFYLLVALAFTALLAVLRFALLKRANVANVANVGTWGCGYSKPSSSMQYTASSFAEPITDTFDTLLNLEKNEEFNEETLPLTPWRFTSHVNDWILNSVFIPLVKLINATLGLLRWIQGGKVGVYVLYIILTLLALIAWMFIIWK